MKRVSLCGPCYLDGYCRKLISRVVTDEELTPAFIRDVRAYMAWLGMGHHKWVPFLIAAYRDYPGRIVAADGHEVYLDTSVLGGESIAYWFRDMVRPVPAHVTPRLRAESRERFKVVAGILRALDPARASLWGKTIANDNEANDNLPAILPPPVAAPECRYHHFAYWVPWPADNLD